MSWRSRRRTGQQDDYRSAHRLLTRLELISRQLPSGLDEVALAQQTLEQIAHVVAADRSVLFVRREDDFVAYAVRGADRVEIAPPDTGGWDALLDPGDPVAAVGIATGSTLPEALIPLSMGESVVGVVALQNDTQVFDLGHLQAAMPAADEAALRIDSGRLFAEVRSTATMEERRRLAREIHDGIAQELASMGYALDALVGDLAGSPFRADADAIRAEVRRIITELRLSIFDLRADVQPGVGLGAALTAYVQQAGADSGLTVHSVLNEAGRLSLPQETEILRIAQEAVTNVRRHAKANNVWVTCRVEPPYAFLRVADDGRGMDSSRKDSFGLDIMQERANRIGASLTWHPRDGGGTVLEVTLQPHPRDLGEGASG